MAKRFTDTEKWKKQFIKSLSTVQKLFFFYILDECDHAGIWHVEPEIAELRIGESFDIEELKTALGKHIIIFDDGEKWFIPYFVEFQYGELNKNVNAHKSVIDRLTKYHLLKKYQQFINPSLRVKDKDKDMDKDKDKEKKDKFVPPTFEEFKEYCVENGFGNIAERAYKGYEAGDWHDAQGNKIKRWKQKLINGWFSEKNKDPLSSQTNLFTQPPKKYEYPDMAIVQSRLYQVMPEDYIYPGPLEYTKWKQLYDEHIRKI